MFPADSVSCVVASLAHESAGARLAAGDTTVWDRRFIWYLVVISAISIGYILFLSPGLLPDEAYFWDLSRRPQLAYLEKPPLVNYLIFATTALLGQTELGVRVGAVLCFVAFSSIAYALGKRVLDDPRAAFVAAALPALAPISTAARVIITPDSLLMVAWILILYGSHEALFRSRSTRGWAIVSAGLVMGLMAKLTTLFALLCLAGLLAATPEFRGWLRRPGPYLAVACGLLGLLPSVIWNAQNDWSTVRHLSWQAHVSEGLSVSLASFAEFVGSQLLVLSPLLCAGLFAGMAWAGVRGIRHGSSLDAFLFWFSAPILGLFLLKSLQGSTLANWAAVAYVAGAYALIRWFHVALAAAAPPGKARLRALAWTTVGVAAAFTLLAHNVSALALVGISQGVDLDPLTAGMGWREVARAADHAYLALAKEGPAVVMASRYQVTSELAFYMAGQPRVYNLNWGRRENQYDLWDDLRSLTGTNAVVVELHDIEAPAPLVASFESCDRQPPVVIYRYGLRARAFTLFVCRGYRGPDVAQGAPRAEAGRERFPRAAQARGILEGSPSHRG